MLFNKKPLKNVSDKNSLTYASHSSAHYAALLHDRRGGSQRIKRGLTFVRLDSHPPSDSDYLLFDRIHALYQLVKSLIQGIGTHSSEIRSHLQLRLSKDLCLAAGGQIWVIKPPFREIITKKPTFSVRK